MQIYVGSKHLVGDVAVALDVTGREHLVIVAKASWLIPEPGQRAKPLVPTPLALADQFYGDPGESALRYGSDFPRFKRRCDVLFDACAHSLNGDPVRKMDVQVQVGAMQKQLRVHGARQWHRLLGIENMSEAEPFTCVPLHFGLAYGGARSYKRDGQTLVEAHLQNPVGLGYAGRHTAEQAHGAAVPQLEDPKKPVRMSDGGYVPVALSAIGRHWSPRRELAGTYDAAWQRDVFPLLPADFDEAYHQCAPPDQQIDYPKGGEVVLLKGLLPRRVELRFALPKLALHAHAQRVEGSSVSQAMRADTLFFETEARRFSAVWRASLPLRRHMQEYESVAISTLDREQWLARQAKPGCLGCGSPTAALVEEVR